MKRFFTLLLALVLILTMLPMQAEASGEKLVALTFDDGPHKTYTKQLLDGLLELDAKVTFFMVGQNAQSYPDLVQRAYDEGHEVANHTWSHPDLTGQGYSGTQSQLSKTNAVLDTVCGVGTTHILRPPYGSYNSTVCSAAGVPLIYWSVDTRDWATRNYSSTYNHIVNNAYDGAIILCHDIHSATIPAALDAIKTLQAKGYEFVTVSELFRRKGVEMKAGTVYKSCTQATVLSAVEAPVITYEPDVGGARITITSPSGAPVYYTTDGSRFTQQSKVYTEPFVVKCPAEIKAVAAFNLNGGRSEVTTVKVETIPCAAPNIDVTEGKLILSCKTAGAPIYFTLDGSIPTTSSFMETDIVYVEPDTVIRAVAGGGNYELSTETWRYYSAKGNLFADVFPGQWYTEVMDQMATEGLMKGLGKNVYGPNQAVTRAQMVELLFRYDGQSVQQSYTRTNTFTDVKGTEWFGQSLEWAYSNGIVNGYPEGDFRPDQAITRQEMAKIMAGFLAHRGNTLPVGEDCRSQFEDGSQVDKWALEQVNAVVAAGLMQGDRNGCLTPRSTATRAEFSTVLMRMRDLEAQMEQEREEAEKEEAEQETTEETTSGEPTVPEETSGTTEEVSDTTEETTPDSTGSSETV